MKLNSLANEYFDWMCELIGDDRHYRYNSYIRLLLYLNEIEFTYILEMDSNRAVDGIDLRYRFAYEKNYSREYIKKYLDIRPCSVLEMMVALSFSCEESVMDDPDIGNRTGQWFWGMIDNLCLDNMTDDNFNEFYIDEVITRFLNRDYKANGEGGLFTLKHCDKDLRDVDIWYQMMWYLVENFDFSI